MRTPGMGRSSGDDLAADDLARRRRERQQRRDGGAQRGAELLQRRDRRLHHAALDARHQRRRHAGRGGQRPQRHPLLGAALAQPLTEGSSGRRRRGSGRPRDARSWRVRRAGGARWRARRDPRPRAAGAPRGRGRRHRRRTAASLRSCAPHATSPCRSQARRVEGLMPTIRAASPTENRTETGLLTALSHTACGPT